MKIHIKLYPILNKKYNENIYFVQRSWKLALFDDSLDETSKAIKNILCAERMRRSRQPKLVEHVRNLQNEYNEIESKS